MRRTAAICLALPLVLVPVAARAYEGFYAGIAVGANHASSDYAGQVATLPVTAELHLFVRAGAAYTWVDYDTVGTVFVGTPGGAVASAPSPKPPKLNGNGTRAVLAAGASHRLADRWTLRAEYTRYLDAGGDYGVFPVGERGRFDLGTATIGLAYRF